MSGSSLAKSAEVPGPTESGSTALSCPRCGGNEIAQRRDAWEVRTLIGFDKDWEPILSEDSEVEAFDDAHFECDSCGFKSSHAIDFLAEDDPAAEAS